MSFKIIWKLILINHLLFYSVSAGVKFGELKPVTFEVQSVFMDVLRKDNSPFVIFKDEISCIMSSDPVHSGHCIVLPSTPIDNW